jgi:hypothetical protein
MAQMLPEPYAALLNGILLGVETGIPHRLTSPTIRPSAINKVANSAF